MVGAVLPLEGFVLSPQQRRLWRLGGCAPEAPYYVSVTFDILGDRRVCMDEWAKALDAATAEYEILRTELHGFDGMAVPLQVVAEAPSPSGKPLHLSQEDGRLTLRLPGHCGDLGSLQILAEALCRHLAGGPAPPDFVQYADYAQWQHDVAAAQEAAAGKAFWRARFDPRTLSSALPLSRRAGANDAFQPQQHAIPLPDGTMTRLQQTANRLGVSPQTVLAACWFAALQKIGGEDGQTVGYACEGREFPELAHAIGPMTHTLPLFAEVGGPFAAFAQALQRSIAEVRQNADAFSWAYDTAQDEVVFPAGFSFFAARSASGGGITLRPDRFTACIDRFQVQLSCVVADDSALTIALDFDAARLHAREAGIYADLFRRILEDALVDPEAALETFGRLRPGEWVRDAEAGMAPDPGTLHARIAAQAARVPQHIAVACEGGHLTYRELDADSNRWARHLQSLGVTRGSTVVLAVERSLLLPVLLLAVLKAGGAYVPVEARTPPARLRKIVETAGARLVMASEPQDDMPEDVPCLTLAAEAVRVAALSAAPVSGAAAANDLAYVIFTSGSSGEPKGVAVEHRQILNYVDGVCARLALGACESFAHVSSIAADLGNTTLYGALLQGRKLVLAGRGEMLDAGALSHRFAAEGGVDCLKIAPSHLKALLDAAPDGLLPAKMLILGGERFDRSFAEALRARGALCRIANHYGPTEATVGALVHELTDGESACPSATVPLGTPLAHVAAIVLDDTGYPVPPGVVGELHIAGAGLARGYCGDPERTAASFITIAPFDTAPLRVYRTGDRVRRLGDGALEFLGRRDRQIKLHGVRIELGEIEAAAQAHSAVRSAAALLRETAPGRQGLVLFAAASDLAASVLRAHLERHLTPQMMPARIVMLGALPVTQNGKCDYAALAALTLPEAAGPGGAAPRGEMEAQLAQIWSDVMALPTVGVHDDFFHLGGDSILGIQIVARANEAGLNVTLLQLFERRTIAKLAAVASRRMAVPAEQGAVSGAVPLTPIQRWFFEHEPREPWHWNMALLVETGARVDPDILGRALDRAIAHHDALRMRFERQAEGWVQHNDAVAPAVAVARLDLSARADAEAAMDEAASALQAGFDLASPPLVRAMVFDLRQGSRILFAVHHLVMDAVSWRPFLETVAAAYAALDNGAPVKLPAKTTAFKRWSEQLHAYAEAKGASPQSALWHAAARPAPALPADMPGGGNTVGAADSIDVVLDAETTRALLRDVPVAYQTQIDDALLTALARAVAAWTGRDGIRVEMEGHGRALPFPDADCGRTVGWFTARWPLRLSTEGCADIGAALRSVKEQLRRVPDGGAGYGVLRYLCGDAVLAAAPDPELSFNYLGQVDHALPLAGGWRFAKEPPGAERSPHSVRRQTIAVDAMVSGGQLRLRWTYSRQIHHRATIARLAETYCAQIAEIVRHCAAELRGLYTPSDFPLARLSQSELDTILAHYARSDAHPMSSLQQLITLHLLWEGAGEENHQRALHKLSVEDIFALSPMQQGLLFDILYAEDRSLYKVQKLIAIESTVTARSLRKAWEQVVARHPSLRTVFVWKNVAAPVQVVLGRVDVPWVEWDWTGLSREEQDAALADYLKEDWAQEFALDRAPVMRLALARLAPGRHVLVWTHHHLLLDGWCNSLLLREVLDYAQAFDRGEVPLLPHAAPYRAYVAWLAARDDAGDEAWWRGALGDAVLPTPLAFARDAPAPLAPRDARLGFTFTEQDRAALQGVAKDLGVTLGTLLNGAWALLLSLYSGERDVVFAITVAGRPPDLPGVETMVGLMMNVLPLCLRVEPEQTLADWLRQGQTRQSQLLEHQFTPLAQIRRWTGVRPGRPLFESHLSFENYPVDSALRAPDRPSHIGEVRSIYRTTYPLSITVEAGLEVDVTYDPTRFEEAVLRAVFDQWRDLLTGFPAMLDRPLRDITLGTAAQSFMADLETGD